jgi:hypothetical protein
MTITTKGLRFVLPCHGKDCKTLHKFEVYDPSIIIQDSPQTMAGDEKGMFRCSKCKTGVIHITAVKT